MQKFPRVSVSKEVTLYTALLFLTALLYQVSEKSVLISTGPDSSSEDDEDASSVSPRSIRSPLFLSAHLERLSRGEIPAETHIQNKEDTLASDTQVCHPIHT